MAEAAPFRLGDLVVIPDRLLIRSSATEEHRVRNLDMGVLLTLAEQAPEIVSQDELLTRVWPRGFVNKGVVGNAIYRLRGTLGNDTGVRIETVRSRGYRLTVKPTPLAATNPESNRASDDRQPAAPRWTQGSPYRGLQPFLADHEAVFFGRDRDTQRLLEKLEQQAEQGKSFLLLLGPSGAGKTSLLEAGLIPALLRGADETRELSALNADWHVGHYRPNPELSVWQSLAQALQEAQPDWRPSCDTSVAQALQDDLLGILDDLQSHLQADPKTSYTNRRVFLVADQFEALLSGSTRAPDAFFEALLTMSQTGVIWIAAALRSDFYHEFSKHGALLRLKGPDGQFDVTTPELSQIGNIIRQPAAAAGLKFGTDPASGTTLDMVLQAEAHQGAEALPLLQFMLDALYQNLCQNGDDDGTLGFEPYTQLGGLAGAIATRAEEVFATLDASAQAELPAVLSAMVETSADGVAPLRRRLAPMRDLAGEPARERLLDAFIAARLFVADRTGSTPTVTLAHEALLRRWTRAGGILSRNRQQLAARQRLTDAATHWEQNARDESYLLGAGLLAEATPLQQHPELKLSEAERELIQRSARRDNRRRWRSRATGAALALLAGLATIAAGVAMQQQRATLQLARQADETADFLVQVFESASPGAQTTYSTSARELVNQAQTALAANLNTQPGVRAQLTRTLGVAYMGFGEYDRAKELLEDAREQRLDLGEPHVGLVQSTNDLGRLQYLQGNYDEAEQHYVEALKIVQQNGLAGTAEHAQTLNNQGEIAIALGHYAEAIAAHTQALQMREQALGHEAVATATSLQNLAGAFRKSGELTQAEAHYRDALERLTRQLGPEHPEVAVAQSNLGLLLADTNRLPAARTLLEAALDTRQRVFGRVHPHSANSAHNLAAALFKQKTPDAEVHLRESLAVHRELYGEDHDSVAYARNNLATMLLESDSCGEARPLFQAAHTGLLRLLGAEHPNTALIQGNLARAQLTCGSSVEAGDHAAQALAVLTRKLPAGHWRTAAVRSIYGASLAAAGDRTQAEAQLREALSQLTAALGEDHDTTAKTRERLAQITQQSR